MQKKTLKLITICFALTVILALSGCKSSDDKKDTETATGQDAIEFASPDEAEDTTESITEKVTTEATTETAEATSETTKSTSETTEDTFEATEATTTATSNNNPDSNSSSSGSQSANSSSGSSGGSSSGNSSGSSSGNSSNSSSGNSGNSSTPATEATTEATTETTTEATTEEPEAYYIDYASSVLTYVNEYRAAVGAPPLSLNYTLVAACQIRSKELVTSFSHSRPDGSSCFSAISEAGGGYGAAGENIAAGQWDPKSVVDDWAASPGHYENMISTSFTQMGVSCYYDESSEYGMYWTQLFTN